MPAVRVNSQTTLAQHSCSNTLHQDMSFAPAVDTYPRLTPPLVDRRNGGRRRQDSQMQGRRNIDRQRQWHEDKKGDTGIYREEKTFPSISNVI